MYHLHIKSRTGYYCQYFSYLNFTKSILSLCDSNLSIEATNISLALDINFRTGNSCCERRSYWPAQFHPRLQCIVLFFDFISRHINLYVHMDRIDDVEERTFEIKAGKKTLYRAF